MVRSPASTLVPYPTTCTCVPPHLRVRSRSSSRSDIRNGCRFSCLLPDGLTCAGDGCIDYVEFTRMVNIVRARQPPSSEELRRRRNAFESKRSYEQGFLDGKFHAESLQRRRQGKQGNVPATEPKPRPPAPAKPAKHPARFPTLSDPRRITKEMQLEALERMRDNWAERKDGLTDRRSYPPPSGSAVKSSDGSCLLCCTTGRSRGASQGRDCCGQELSHLCGEMLLQMVMPPSGLGCDACCAGRTSQSSENRDESGQAFEGYRRSQLS